MLKYWQSRRIEIFLSLCSDIPLGAEFGAVSYGLVPVSLLPVQPAGMRASKSKTPTRRCFPPHQTVHGSSWNFFSIILPCPGMNYIHTNLHALKLSTSLHYSLFLFVLHTYFFHSQACLVNIHFILIHSTRTGWSLSCLPACSWPDS